MTTTLDLIELSKWAGQRFDLVQAGGGNSSYKVDATSMLIKTSGTSLSEVSTTSGFATIDLVALRKGLTKLHKQQATLEKKELEAAGEELLAKVKDANESARPSIETFLHIYLDTYALHTHGIVVNTIACRNNWQEVFEQVFPESLCISYKTPGIELALELDSKISDYLKAKGKKPSVIFLQNHGLIVTAPTAAEVKFLTEEVTVKLEEFLSITNNTYRLSSVVSETIKAVFGLDKISYLTCDAGLRELIVNAKPLFFQQPFCPDTLVYCGKRLLVLNDFTDTETMAKYKEMFSEVPRVIICRDLIFFIADSVRKARDIEEMLKFHLSVLVVNVTQKIQPQDIHFLEEEELTYLANWNAEKYRQAV
jgi:rhamnose utilization protein RhaD (predicted bifunctional aldolase and dehydrogenase)